MNDIDNATGLKFYTQHYIYTSGRKVVISRNNRVKLQDYLIYINSSGMKFLKHYPHPTPTHLSSQDVATIMTENRKCRNQRNDTPCSFLFTTHMHGLLRKGLYRCKFQRKCCIFNSTCCRLIKTIFDSIMVFLSKTLPVQGFQANTYRQNIKKKIANTFIIAMCQYLNC